MYVHFQQPLLIINTNQTANSWYSGNKYTIVAGDCIQNPLSLLCSWGCHYSQKLGLPNIALKRVPFPQMNRTRVQVCSMLYPDAVVPQPAPPPASPSASPSLLGNTLNKAPGLPMETCQFFNKKRCLCIDLRNFQITQR